MVSLLQKRRSGFREKALRAVANKHSGPEAGQFNLLKECGGLPARRYDGSGVLGLNRPVFNGKAKIITGRVFNSAGGKNHQNGFRGEMDTAGGMARGNMEHLWMGRRKRIPRHGQIPARAPPRVGPDHGDQHFPMNDAEPLMLPLMSHPAAAARYA